MNRFQPPAQPFLERVLLTNDDGFDAPGLAVLEHIARQVAREVWIVAPATDQSGVSHAISLHAPLRVAEKAPRRFAVAGTPGDCVVIGLRDLLRELPVDYVLSGVNRGANLGAETVFSGTVGAGMTALLLGHRAIALSLAFGERREVDWTTPEATGAAVIARLHSLPWVDGVCMNVNFPPVPPDRCGPLTITRQGLGRVRDIHVDTRTDPRLVDYAWLNFERGPIDDASDSEALVVHQQHAIAATPLSLERTNGLAYDAMRAALG